MTCNAIQFVSSYFLIKEINTTHTGVVTFDNLWVWGRYFGALSFYFACNCWYFITILKKSTKHCHSTIIKPFHSNHVIGILKIDVTSFHIFIFFHNSYFFQSLPTVPRQYITLSKSFSANDEELKKIVKKSIQCAFSNFLDKSKTTVFGKPLFFNFSPR